MPIYEYECNACKEKVEMIHRQGETKTVCPLCEQEALNRIISITNFELKGKGFYKTDYKNRGTT